MSLHYSNPDDKLRDCPRCDDNSWWFCNYCCGEGRLGDPDAQPDIEVEQFVYVDGEFWVWRPLRNYMSPYIHWCDRSDTEAEALRAARKTYARQ